MSSGKLITVEGIDGSGKTTLVQGLMESLKEQGLNCHLLREPGGVQLSEKLRDIVKDNSLTIGPRAEALIYAAARAQLIEEKLRPLLAEGQLVLLDRFVDSSLAYQGGGRNLGIKQIKELNDFATSGLTPDLTLLLKIDPKLAIERQSKRGGTSDRLEAEGLEFLTKIATVYDQLAAKEPERFYVIDASEDISQILATAQQAVAKTF